MEQKRKSVVVRLQISFNPMNSYRTKYTLEIFSGSLLEKRREWQQIKEQLPARTYLLVTPLTNSAPTHVMLKIGRALQEAGMAVMVLSVG